jgi:hypothetical protein
MNVFTVVKQLQSSPKENPMHSHLKSLPLKRKVTLRLFAYVLGILLGWALDFT